MSISPANCAAQWAAINASVAATNSASITPTYTTAKLASVHATLSATQ